MIGLTRFKKIHYWKWLIVREKISSILMTKSFVWRHSSSLKKSNHTGWFESISTGLTTFSNSMDSLHRTAWKFFLVYSERRTQSCIISLMLYMDLYTQILVNTPFNKCSGWLHAQPFRISCMNTLILNDLQWLPHGCSFTTVQNHLKHWARLKGDSDLFEI